MQHGYGNAASEHLRAAHRVGKERGAPIDQDLEAIPQFCCNLETGRCNRSSGRSRVPTGLKDGTPVDVPLEDF
ncbi:hypothetical protein BTUL_0156g00300 [Botrytis tulipae]|uniref:Uncharacterized protein n=1 Tax=Botrytis tulipae TaxID=87230 RepID=A0A4Z1EBP3_9HELO|nr:hypothetical protein BTUL_0156g00300 [Botrytis tulipae]